MNTFRRAVKVANNEGLDSLMKKAPPYIYQQIWPFLPSDGHITLNNVNIGQRKRVLDDYLPDYLTKYVPSDNPNYEHQYIGCIQRHIKSGERVAMVGGGAGVSTVIAAKQVQPTGRVDVFEGGAEEVERTQETLVLNDVSDIVTVHHAIVSNDFSLGSSAGGADVIPTNELPDCDTLAIDADGAEFPILDELEITPKRLIVEHHAIRDGYDIILDYQPEKIRSLIQNLGYGIVEERAKPDSLGYSGKIPDPAKKSVETMSRFEERIFVAEQI